MLVDYIYNYSVTINLIAFPSCTAEIRQRASNLRSAYYANVNLQAFNSLLILVDTVCIFLFHYLPEDHEQDNQDDSINDDLLSTDNINKEETGLWWQKLGECLIEIKQFKNYQDHIHTCLRAKHTHVNCKIELARPHSRHMSLTVIAESGCVFAKVSLKFFLSLDLYSLIRLIEKYFKIFIFFLLFFNNFKHRSSRNY